MSTLDAELEFRRLRYSSFLGTAKVYLQHLQIDTSNTFTLDEKNVKRILGIFEIQGCLRLDVENYVPVLISRGALEASFTESDVEPQDLYNYDDLKLLRFGEHVRLRVLHGRHRLRAAQHFLQGDDRWWVVDLYDDSMILRAGSFALLNHSRTCRTRRTGPAGSVLQFSQLLRR
jgi:Protein of unknown function (DUF3723)